MANQVRITGTFLDEITMDIPHQNWGRAEWDADFKAMKAMGIKRVILIRCAWNKFMAYPSAVIPAHGGKWHTPPVDLIDLFLDLAEKYGLEFYASNADRRFLKPGNTEADNEEEAAVGQEIIRELWERYGKRKAFAGWYLTEEICSNAPGVIPMFVKQGRFAKQLSGNLPVLISPYFNGCKIFWDGHEQKSVSVEEHLRQWTPIFEALKGAVDIVAFQDGHVDFDELGAFHLATRQLAVKYGIQCWSNIESFDRDMPLHFLPITWEKMLWKMQQADQAGITDAITFEFSHFMSPHSLYRSAAGLFDRYCEYCGLPARSADF